MTPPPLTLDERLPTPKLDDRRFQDLVDEAKRRVQQRCPEWTDHNVSDPGVTLIETFAWMTDQLLYRLNRVPDLNYVKFLELLGVTLLPPTAASTELTFRLSKAQPNVVNVPSGTQVSTPRSGSGEQITFATTAPLPIVPCEQQTLASADPLGSVRHHSGEQAIVCFSDRPQPGDALLVGLNRAVPSCVVRLHLACKPGAGGGIAPDNPPLVWDARVGEDEGTVQLWNVRTRESLLRFTGYRGQALRCVAFSPDGHMLASAGEVGAVWLRDVHEPEQLGRRLDGHKGPVLSIAFNADGHTLASAGEDGTVRLWDVHDPEPGHEQHEPGRRLDGHDGPVFGVAFHPEGRMLASAGADGTVRLWDVDEHAPLRTLGVQEHREPEASMEGAVPDAGPRRSMLGVAFLQGGQTLAAADDNGTLWLWDLRRPEQSALEQFDQQLGGHRGAVLGVAFSPDGQMLATAGADGTARLWDFGTPVPEGRGHVLIGHQGAIHGVAFSPDGQTLATVGSDWTARLWSVATGEQRGRPVSDHCPVRGVAFHPHGDRLATASLDGGWEACEIESDGTKGLNEAASVILHVPRSHRASTVGEQTAGWLRCRVRAVRKGQSPYDKSPVIEGECLAETIGATMSATNSETVFGEVLGVSEGVSGQRFRLDRRPLVPLPGNEQHVLEVVLDGRIDEWHEVPSFADADEDEKSFVLDCAAGEVVLGPAVREKNDATAGRYRGHGAVPPKRAELRLRKYATNSGTVFGEVLGVSDGVSGQRFLLDRRRLVPLPGNEQHVLEVLVDGDTEEWHEVPSFADAKEDEQCFVLDYAAGEVVVGPAVREKNDATAGRYRRYGAVPPKRAELRLHKYATGGGRRGNVSDRTLTVLRSPIANIASVENRRPASGGVDGEDIENAKLRGPITLRTGDRAVTPEDFEQLAREAAPELARVECIPATGEAHAGEARVLVVPKVESDNGELRFEQLVPSVEAINRIKGYLDRRRVIGVRVLVTPPHYRGLTIVAKLVARREFDSKDVERRALEDLYTSFSPISGGRDGKGWEFGRPVLQGDVYAVLQSVRGVERVDDCRLFEANPVTGLRTPVDTATGTPGHESRSIEVPVSRYATLFSYRHYVVVEPQ